jgi:hypothetical protein
LRVFRDGRRLGVTGTRSASFADAKGTYNALHAERSHLPSSTAPLLDVGNTDTTGNSPSSCFVSATPSISLAFKELLEVVSTVDYRQPVDDIAIDSNASSCKSTRQQILCPKGHNLLSRDPEGANMQPIICDACKIAILEYFPKSFHCSICKYDLCDLCGELASGQILSDDFFDKPRLNCPSFEALLLESLHMSSHYKQYDLLTQIFSMWPKSLSMFSNDVFLNATTVGHLSILLKVAGFDCLSKVWNFFTNMNLTII